MTQAYTTIQKLLDAQTKKASGIPLFTAENFSARPSAETPWCRSTLLPAETQIIGIGQDGWRADQGLYQVDVFYPQNAGSELPNAIADAIQNTFVRGTYLVDAVSGVAVLIKSIWRQPASSLTQAMFYQIPVMVRWEYYDQS